MMARVDDVDRPAPPRPRMWLLASTFVAGVMTGVLVAGGPA